MSIATKPESASSTTSLEDRAAEKLLKELAHWFDADFSLWNVLTPHLLRASQGGPVGCETLLEAHIRSVPRGEPAVIFRTRHVALLGLPVEGRHGEPWVATAPLLIDRGDVDDDLRDTQHLLELPTSEARDWINQQKLWDMDSLMRLAGAVVGKLSLQAETERLEKEIKQVSQKLASTYEEISLLYGVTQNLRLTSSKEQLGALALEWLSECLPASCLAIQFLPVDSSRPSQQIDPAQCQLLEVGACPLDDQQLTQLVKQAQRSVEGWPYLVDRTVSSSPGWRFPDVRQLILAPLYEGEKIHGWIAAFNHVEDESFDMMAASLLTSVGAILGIHSGNHHLCRQQSEFMANVVRALTSAIDAKDPYTCGHSDRVARISVALARQLGCDQETMSTIYLAGLLHDIGKIGIEDSVLRKSGRLSNAEFEHIKLHPELGYRILKEFDQFAEVLPVVLHHHEHWDGSGYPYHLAGEDIPYLARICAVADAYDAMTSDRPYRRGMSHRKVERIFRNGAGCHWDPAVIDAFFAVKHEIRSICRHERTHLELDFRQWS